MEFTVEEAFETSSHLHIKVEFEVDLRLAVHARVRWTSKSKQALEIGEEVYFVDGSALHQHR